MAGPKQDIISAWERVKKDMLLPDSVLKRAAKDAATAQLDVIRQRNLAQIGPDGNRFRRNSREWTEEKRKILSGKRKYKEWKRKTALAMTDPSQVGRLTGRTIADLTSTGHRVKRYGSTIDLFWTIGMRSTRRAGGVTSAELVNILKSVHKIDLFGASKAGPYKKKEEEAVRNVVKRSLALNLNAQHELLLGGVSR